MAAVERQTSAEDEASYDDDMSKALEQMFLHPLVIAAQSSVVVLAETNDAGEGHDIAASILKQLREAKIKTWDFLGKPTATVQSVMPAVLQVCSVVVLVCTPNVASTNSTAIKFFSFATSCKSNRNKKSTQLIAIKAEPTVRMNAGQLGLVVNDAEVIDLSMDSSSSPYKKAFKKLTKTISKEIIAKEKLLKKSKGSSSGTTSDARDMAAAVRKQQSVESTKMRRDSKSVATDPEGSVVLLYAWGLLSHGRFRNQSRVQTIKHYLKSRGFKVWMDVDNIDYSVGDDSDHIALLKDAITRCDVVIVCVTRSFHLPQSVANDAFLHALAVKEPGQTIFPIKMSITADMACGAYGLYMSKVKYYDIARGIDNGLEDADSQMKLDEMTRDITRLKAATMRVNVAECVYGTLKTIKGDDAHDPAVGAAVDSVMLSYSWGAQVANVFPNQMRVMRLADLLHRHGFSIWMDVDHMAGNMDVVMAGAIEHSAAVVACGSDGYMRVGSNASKEWAFANQTKVLGRSLFVANVTHEFQQLLPLAGKKSDKTALKGATFNVSPDVTSSTDGSTSDGFQSLVSALIAAGVPRAEAIYVEPKVQDEDPPELPARPGRPNPAAADLRLSWWVGVQDRETVRDLFAAKSTTGDYVVRGSKSDPGAYVLVVNDGHRVRERKIAYTDGHFLITIDHAPKSYESMDDLLGDIPEVDRVPTFVSEFKVESDD